MPNYGTVGPVAVYPGQQYAMFNAESPTPAQASASVTIPKHTNVPIAFTVAFATSPTDSLVIQGSMVDVDASYQTLYTSTNTQKDVYLDYGKFQFYRANLASQSGGGAVTVIIKR
jgi:hypothetical protein